MQESVAVASNSIDLMMVLHRKTGDDILVSDTGDPGDAVSIPAAAVKIAMAKTPGFVVITMPERLAREKGLV